MHSNQFPQPSSCCVSPVFSMLSLITRLRSHFVFTLLFSLTLFMLTVFTSGVVSDMSIPLKLFSLALEAAVNVTKTSLFSKYNLFLQSFKSCHFCKSNKLHSSCVELTHPCRHFLGNVPVNIFLAPAQEEHVPIPKEYC